MIAGSRAQRRLDNTEHTSVGKRATLVLVPILAFSGILATLKNGFISLDDAYVLSADSVAKGLRVPSVVSALADVSTLYWHPLTWISHAIDVELFGQQAAGHHLTSILLHAMCAALFFLVFLRLGAHEWPAAFAALWWALHPLRVESFAWVAERKDVLCAAFFLATILAYVRWIEAPSRQRYWAWNGLASLALMSKPTGVTLVVILMILDYWPLARKQGLGARLREKGYLLAATVGVAVLTVVGQSRSGSMSHLADVPWWVRLENVPISYVRYLGKVFWPVNLACFYPYDRHPQAVWVALSVVALGAITGVAVWQRARRPWLLAGWVWFLAALIPNIGLLQAGRQSIADRFTHLAMIGLAIAAAWTAAEFWSGARWAAGGLIVVLALLTVRQIGYWHDSVTLFEHAVAVEDSDYMRGNLGTVLLTAGRTEEAARHLREAVRLGPSRWEHHNNLANALLRLGDVEGAYSAEQTALRLAPDKLAVAETMGAVLLRRTDWQGALTQFDRAVELGGDSRGIAVLLNDTGASLANRGRAQEAKELLRKAADLDPGLVQARRNLVLALLDGGRLEEARVSLREAIRATGTQPAYRDLAIQLGLAEPDAGGG